MDEQGRIVLTEDVQSRYERQYDDSARTCTIWQYDGGGALLSHMEQQLDELGNPLCTVQHDSEGAVMMRTEYALDEQGNVLHSRTVMPGIMDEQAVFQIEYLDNGAVCSTDATGSREICLKDAQGRQLLYEHYSADGQLSVHRETAFRDVTRQSRSA